MVGGALLLGAVLRTWQWAAATSLWVDELWIVQNVRDRGLAELLSRPLEHQQVAPAGFLAAVDVSSILLGFGELALRLVPYLMALLSLLLLLLIARRYVGGLPLVGVILLAAASPALVWYGGNVKPYSGDIALTLLVVLLAMRHVEKPLDMRRAVWAGVLGAVAIVSSFPTVLTSAVLGVLLLIHWLRDRRPGSIGPLTALGGGWLVGAAIATWSALRLTTPEVQAYMRDFWAEGFPPYADGLLSVALWIPERAYHALAHALVFLDAEAGVLAAPIALLALGGIVAGIRRRGVLALMLLAPVIGGLLGALAGTLPLRNRTAVYAGPALIVSGMIGLQALLRHDRRWVRIVGIAAAIVSVIPIPALVLAGSRPPYRTEETRAVLAELVRRRAADDRVYVYCHAHAAADFYGRPAGLTDYIEGGCHDSTEELREELRTLPAGPIWFFWTHATSTGLADSTRAYFEANGSELDRIPDPYGLTGEGEAAAIRYDLGPPDAS